MAFVGSGRSGSHMNRDKDYKRIERFLFSFLQMLIFRLGLLIESILFRIEIKDWKQQIPTLPALSCRIPKK